MWKRCIHFLKKIDLDKNTKDEINTIKRDLKKKLNEFLNSDTLTKIKNTISENSTVTDGIFEKYKDNFEKRYVKTILNAIDDDLITLFNEFGEVGEIQTQDLDLFISLLSVSVKDEGKEKRIGSGNIF